MSILDEYDVKEVYMSQCLKRYSVRPSSMEVGCNSIIDAAHSDLDHIMHIHVRFYRCGWIQNEQYYKPCKTSLYITIIMTLWLETITVLPLTLLSMIPLSHG